MIEPAVELSITDKWMTEWCEELRSHCGDAVRRGKMLSVKDGRWIALAPLGYQNVRRHGKALIEIDPPVAPLIQEAFHLAAEGTHSSREIVGILTERGLRSRRGNPVTAADLHKILTNPFYIGKMRFKGEDYRGVHPPLIDKQLFQQVQRNLTGK